ncbi:MAG: alpha/beta fold hydrolase [Planctomycetaceae bacterium]|nr:alpha/beta hydrolase [Planctomycetaceae bacterium]
MSEPPHIPWPLDCPLEGARRPQPRTLRLADGYETGMLVHSPRGPAAGPCVLYLHGIQSHPGWFAGSAAALADHGCRVYQIERRGSGHNRTDRGHARSAGQLLADLDAAAALIVRENPDRSLALAGPSWGGKLAAAYCLWPRRRAAIASLTMIAPGIAAMVDVPAATKLAVALCLLAAPKVRLAIPLDDDELFTDNPAMREYLRADTLRLRKASAAFMFASRVLDRMIARAPDGSLNVPCTLLLARRERVIDNKATSKVVTRLTADRAQRVEFDAAHVLEFQSDPAAFYQALLRGVQFSKA